MVVVHSLSSNRHRVPLSNLKTPGFLNEVCFPPSGTAFWFFVFSAYLCKLNTFISFHIIWLSWKPLQVQIRVPLSKSHVNRRRFRSHAFVKVFVAYKRFSSSNIWRTGGKSEGKRRDCFPLYQWIRWVSFSTATRSKVPTVQIYGVTLNPDSELCVTWAFLMAL